MLFLCFQKLLAYLFVQCDFFLVLDVTFLWIIMLQNCEFSLPCCDPHIIQLRALEFDCI
jgi:hypothetical protein